MVGEVNLPVISLYRGMKKGAVSFGHGLAGKRANRHVKVGQKVWPGGVGIDDLPDYLRPASPRMMEEALKYKNQE